MDELEHLTEARPDPTPDPEVVEAHRATLRAAIDADAGQALAPEAPVVELAAPRRPRRWLPAAAAVVLVAAAGLAVATTGDDDPADVQVDTASTTAPPVASTPVDVAATTTCGPLPFELDLPDGFVRTRVFTNNSNSLVVDYEGPTGVLELYWPGFPTPTRDPDVFEVPGDPDGGGLISSVFHVDGSVSLRAVGFGLGNPPCDVVSVILRGVDPSATETIAVAVQDSLVAAGGRPPLVTATRDDDAVPVVGPCESPTSPNVGETVAGQPPHASPQAALEGFLAGQTVVMEEFGIEVERPRFLMSGYEELHLADGTTAFVHHPNPERPDFVGTLVVVSNVDGGYAVTRWEASGC